MNILNILGIVSAGQKNVAAGQALSATTTAPQQRSLFLPMLLKLFAGGSSKTETSTLLQQQVDTTTQPSNEGRQITKSAANHLGPNNSSAETGFEFLTNGVTPLGSLFAAMQNMQRDAQPKTISSGAGVEVESGPDSEHVSLSQSSATGVPVVAEVQQSSELAFSVAEVPVGNPQTSVSLTSSGTQSHTDSLRMWVGQTSMSDGVPLVGFEFMKDSASSTTSGTVQGVSPEGAEAQPAAPDSHLDEAGKNLVPALPSTKIASDDFQLTGLRQPPVSSTNSSVTLPPNESTGNAVVAAGFSSAPSTLSDVGSTLVSQNTFPGLTNAIQQSSVGKTAGDTKASANGGVKSKDESPSLNLNNADSILPLEPEVSPKTVSKENILTPKSIPAQRPEILLSVPEGSLSPKAAVIADSNAVQPGNLGRRDVAAVPVEHSDTKGNIEKGQETDTQGTAKGGTVTVHEAVKTGSEAGPSDNSSNYSRVPSSSKPAVQSGEVETSAVLPQAEKSGDGVVAAGSSSAPSTLSDVGSTLVSQNTFPGLTNAIQQSSVGKTAGDTKASANGGVKSKDESPSLNLNNADSILPLEPEVSPKTVSKENILTPKSIPAQRPEVLFSLPEGSLSPKAAVIADSNAVQPGNLGRRDVAAVPVEHSDTKGNIEKGQETDTQGTAKGGTVTVHEAVKTGSEAGSSNNSSTNEQFHLQEKIVKTSSAIPDSDPLQSSAEVPAAKTEAAIPLAPNIESKNLSIPATQAELLARMTSQISGLHNQPVATLRPESSTLSAATPLSTQSGVVPGSIEQAIMDQVSKNLALNLNSNSSEVRIAMKPESLGEVVMKVKMDDGKVSAQINVNSVNVKAVLDANVSQLRDTLLAKGIEVQHIDIVADGQTAFGSSSGQNKPKQKSQQGDAQGVDALGQYESLRTMGYNTIELIM